MSDKNDAAASVSKEDVQGESNTQSSDTNGNRLASVHGLKRQLKNRHAQMITIGKSINPPSIQDVNHKYVTVQVVS